MGETYYTTNQLQKMVADKEGKPCTSRNRDGLMKRAGLVARKPHSGGKGGRKAAKAAPKKSGKAKATAKTEKKPAKPPAKAKPAAPVTIRSDAALHAKAIAAVKARSGLSLRAMCAKLEADGVLTPRGGKKWFPSSVQNLMRQGA